MAEVKQPVESKANTPQAKYHLQTFRPGLVYEDLEKDAKYKEICDLDRNRTLGEAYPSRFNGRVAERPEILHTKRMYDNPEVRLYKAQPESEDPNGTLFIDNEADAKYIYETLRRCTKDNRIKFTTVYGGKIPKDLVDPLAPKK